MYPKNTPQLWQDLFPWPQDHMHKYHRGSVIIFGGGSASTGAACLAATAALRIGAGLVSIACPASALPIYASKLNAVMTKPFKHTEEALSFIEDPRNTAFCIGPGNGVTPQTKELTLAILKSQQSCVIDADALTVFHENANALCDAIQAPTILTPHEGEFTRLFSLDDDRTASVIQAAKQSNAVVILKGHNTIIASPDGEVVVNSNAPATLATAGSGDVLAGIATGLLANQVAPFHAACMATWIHGECANLFGPGLIAEDLLDSIPKLLQSLKRE